MSHEQITTKRVVYARKRLPTKSFGKKRLSTTPKKKRAVQGKIKSKSLSKLKAELDRVFSLFIRRNATNCYTCGKQGTPQTLQCGHFIPRQYLSVRWYENNCRPQCVGCNIWGKGKFLEFEEKLIQEVGADEVFKMKEERKVLVKLTREFYEREISHYKSLLDGDK